MPVCRRLIGCADAEQSLLGEGRAQDLHADGQTGRIETAGYAQTANAGQVG